MRVGIIGTGVQCKRRAAVIVSSSKDTLVAIASRQVEHAQAAAREFRCEADDDWQHTVARPDVDAIIVCTPPRIHAAISIAAMQSGKHVLCEKPLSRTLEEAEAMVAVSRETGRVLKCGFNHRHHPAILEAKARLDAGALGAPLFARCAYGICGRPGYAGEWRADPAEAAGGQFMEQGNHIIDLFRWFLGEIVEVACMSSRHYFKGQSLDDGAMAIMRTASGATGSLHTTLVQWKNLFRFEIYGEDGYARVEGLGGSYGTECLSLGRRDFTAPFQEKVIEFRGGDPSWREEWNEFSRAVQSGSVPLGDARDGLAAMRIAFTAYEAERRGVMLPLDVEPHLT